MYNSFATPWTVAHQAPLSMGFARQEYWSRLPILSPGDLPNAGIEPMSPALAGRFSTNQPPGKPAQKHTSSFLEPRKTHTHTHAHPVLSKVCIISFVIIITPIKCCSAALHSSSLFVTLSTADEIRMVLTECFSSPWKAGIRIVVAYSPGQQRH